jgi:hypothetical protein
MVVSSNDYGSCCDQYYTTFDGGQTWTTGNMSTSKNGVTGSDPVTVFDVKHGTVIHPSLNYVILNDGEATDGHLAASVSTDGGLNWASAVIVAKGYGRDLGRRQLFNDKEWIVADNHPGSPHYGRVYMTWSAFLSHNGEYLRSQIREAHSDDGGFTWTRPRTINGSGPMCTIQVDRSGGHECDENQFSVPVVAPDGTVYVAWANEQNRSIQEPGELPKDGASFFDDQYLVVKSADGGRSWSNPVTAAALEDGPRDFPFNVDDRQTLSGFQTRVNAAGNIEVDPTGLSGHLLYIVYSDNRAGQHDVDHPVTNTNVYIVGSNDGTHWSAPKPIANGPSDEWFPWLDISPVDGTIAVAYNGRNIGATQVYNAYLATEPPGQTSFAHVRVSTKPSRARQSLYFRSGDPACPNCATFNGDYINVDIDSTGTAQVSWTDMRRFITVGSTSGYTENAFYARIPLG